MEITDNVNALRPAGLRPKAVSQQPIVFNYDKLWQGKDLLLHTIERLYGHRPLDSFGGSYGWSVRYRQVEDYEALQISTLAEYIDAFDAGSTRLPYLRHLSINWAMPTLRKQLHLPVEFKPNWCDHPWLDRFSGPELFIGQAGTTFGHVHQDQVSVHVGFVQLQGTKEFVVFPPEDGEHLQTFPGREFPYQQRNSRVTYADLQDHDKFPQLSRAHPQVIRLHPGQALLLPANWWHTTCNLADGVSFSIRIVNETNFAQFLGEHIKGIPRLLSRR